MKRTILLFGVLLALATPAHAAIAVVASACATTTNITDVTTAAINTSGATLLVTFTVGAAATATPTDSKSNSWTARTEYNNGGSGGVVRFYYSIPTSTGAGHTFTETVGVPAICVIALSGTHATTPYDVENGDTTDSAAGPTIQPGSVTPSQDNDIVITGATNQQAAGGTPTVNSGFSAVTWVDTNGTGYGVGISYEIQTTATARNPTWTFVNNVNSGAAIVGFKVAAAASATRPCCLGVF